MKTEKAIGIKSQGSKDDSAISIKEMDNIEIDDKMPTADPNEEWVKQYKEQFGTDPSFF